MTSDLATKFAAIKDIKQQYYVGTGQAKSYIDATWRSDANAEQNRRATLNGMASLDEIVGATEALGRACLSLSIYEDDGTPGAEEMFNALCTLASNIGETEPTRNLTPIELITHHQMGFETIIFEPPHRYIVAQELISDVILNKRLLGALFDEELDKRNVAYTSIVFARYIQPWIHAVAPSSSEQAERAYLAHTLKLPVGTESYNELRDNYMRGHANEMLSPSIAAKRMYDEQVAGNDWYAKKLAAQIAHALSNLHQVSSEEEAKEVVQELKEGYLDGVAAQRSRVQRYLELASQSRPDEFPTHIIQTEQARLLDREQQASVLLPILARHERYIVKLLQ